MHYGPVMMDLEDTFIKPEEKEILKHPLIGGVILFKRNYSEANQLSSLVSELRKIAGHPILVTVDHEGGRVWRFKEGFKELPPMQYYGTLYQKNKKEAEKLLHNAGKVMATELLLCGVDLSLAPILDLDRGISSVIGDRAFSDDPVIVAELAGHLIDGMNKAGMQACGKHFPGHGGTAPDTHHAKAIDSRPFDEILNTDVLPFKMLKDKLKAIMPAHVIYSSLDSVPAGFSKICLQDILRKQLGFEGAIISDCLSMKGAALSGDFVVRARLALDAGCDMVIVAEQKRETLSGLLEKLDRKTNDISSTRLSKLAGNFKLARKEDVSLPILQA